MNGIDVIGAGLHRTGSMSVKAALEHLGFGPCYHGMEALRRGADGDHWLRAYETKGELDEPFPRVNAGDNLLVNIRSAMAMARARRPEPVWR